MAFGRSSTGGGGGWNTGGQQQQWGQGQLAPGQQQWGQGQQAPGQGQGWQQSQYERDYGGQGGQRMGQGGQQAPGQGQSQYDLDYGYQTLGGGTFEGGGRGTWGELGDPRVIRHMRENSPGYQPTMGWSGGGYPDPRDRERERMEEAARRCSTRKILRAQFGRLGTCSRKLETHTICSCHRQHRMQRKPTCRTCAQNRNRSAGSQVLIIVEAAFSRRRPLKRRRPSYIVIATLRTSNIQR